MNGDDTRSWEEENQTDRKDISQNSEQNENERISSSLLIL